jgi:hypothetical protein
LELFIREAPQAGTAMAPGMSGAIGGRPKPGPIVKLFSFLVPKSDVTVTIDFAGSQLAVASNNATSETLSRQHATQLDPRDRPTLSMPVKVERCDATVALISLAYGRSGDKGNHSNIGIIARHKDYLPWIDAALSPRAVTAYLAHLLHPEKGRVTRFFLPGIGGFNFLLENSLGGGGIASLRSDPQGKAFAQQLLDFPIPVPAQVAKTVS